MCRGRFRVCADRDRGNGCRPHLQLGGLLEGAEHDGAVGDEGADHAVVVAVELAHDVGGEDGEEEAAVLLRGGADVLLEDELAAGGGGLDAAEVGGGEARGELKEDRGDGDVDARADGEEADGEDYGFLQGKNERGAASQLEEDGAECAEDV